MKEQMIKVWQRYDLGECKFHLFTNLDMYFSVEPQVCSSVEEDESEVIFPQDGQLYNGKEFYQITCYHPFGKGTVKQRTSWFPTIEEALKDAAFKGIPADWDQAVEIGILDMRRPNEPVSQSL